MILLQLEFFERFTSGNIIPSINWGGILNPIMTIMANFIVSAIAILLLWKYVLTPLCYKDEIEIRRYGAEGNFIIVKDRGRFVRDRKTEERKYELWKNRHASVPLFNGGEYYYPLEKGKKKVYMMQTNEVDIRPIHPHELTPAQEPMSLSRRNLMINNLRDIERMFAKESLLKQYLPYLVLVVMTVFFWLAFKSLMEGTTSAFSVLADAIRHSGDKVGSLVPYLENIAGKPLPPPP